MPFSQHDGGRKHPVWIGTLEYFPAKEEVVEMISIMRMEGLEKRYPSQLSSGQQQRVALARALVMSLKPCCWTSLFRHGPAPEGQYAEEDDRYPF